MFWIVGRFRNWLKFRLLINQMQKIKAVLQQKTVIFDNLAQRWHQATGGELALLSPYGEVIKAYNGVDAVAQNIIGVSAAGQVEILPQARAIITPLKMHGELKGHLLSENSTLEQLPMLAWAADTFLEYLDSEEALQGMTDELIAAWDQLELVYKITHTLAENSNLSDALNSILSKVSNVIKVETGFILFTYNDSLECVTLGPEWLSELICQEAFLHRLAKQKQAILFNKQDGLREFWPQTPSYVLNFIGISITTGDQTPAVLGLVNNRDRDFTAGDVKLITAVSEQIRAIIDSFRLYQELIVQERVQRELEIAAEIQESLLLKTIPEFRGLTIDVSSQPAFEVGGDFYDFISPDEEHLTVIVGDVAGKGIPAAMFTSMARTLLKIEALRSQEPHIILKKVNEVLWQDLWQAELFITAIVVTFDKKNGALMYANAGHVPGIIYHAKSNTSRLLKATSLPIGIFGYESKTTQYIHLSPEDTLALYSDGVSEAGSPTGERFGIERIQRLIHQHADKSPGILKQFILKELANFQQMEAPGDDMTLAVVKCTLEEPRSERMRESKILKTIPFRYRADTTYLADVSRQVTSACRSLNGLPPDSKGDDFVYLVELAVSEICTNIIKHAYAGETGDISGRIVLTNLSIQIDIYDQGNSFNPNAVPPPISDPMDPAEGGYGLHIVRQIMDIAEYEADAQQGNHWKLLKYLPT